MKIAFAKPSFGTKGGMESVLVELKVALESQGHAVDVLEVEVPPLPAGAFGLPIPPGVAHATVEVFRYLSCLEQFEQIDTSRFDLVVSTQPPSYAINHERHIGLFYHHLRIYYDLSHAYLAAGFAPPWDHLAAQSAVRRLDAELLGKVSLFLAPPNTRKRLKHFNGLDNVLDFWAGSPIAEILVGMPVEDRYAGPPIVINRQEFPKRSELFVHAMKYLPGMSGIVIGGGGRTAWLKGLDATLSGHGVDLDAFGPADLWLNRGDPPTPQLPQNDSNVLILDRIANAELIDRYRTALCVVGTALDEDYGLTAIEAMAAGRPLIVTADGGGLVEFVEHGVNGFVVEPSGRAIAEAISRFDKDRALAQQMGRAGREMFDSFSWSRGVDTFLNAIKALAS